MVKMVSCVPDEELTMQRSQNGVNEEPSELNTGSEIDAKRWKIKAKKDCGGFNLAVGNEDIEMGVVKVSDRFWLEVSCLHKFQITPSKGSDTSSL